MEYFFTGTETGWSQSMYGTRLQIDRNQCFRGNRMGFGKREILKSTSILSNSCYSQSYL